MTSMFTELDGKYIKKIKIIVKNYILKEILQKYIQT